MDENLFSWIVSVAPIVHDSSAKTMNVGYVNSRFFAKLTFRAILKRFINERIGKTTGEPKKLLRIGRFATKKDFVFVWVNLRNINSGIHKRVSLIRSPNDAGTKLWFGNRSLGDLISDFGCRNGNSCLQFNRIILPGIIRNKTISASI